MWLIRFNQWYDQLSPDPRFILFLLFIAIIGIGSISFGLNLNQPKLALFGTVWIAIFGGQRAIYFLLNRRVVRSRVQKPRG